MSPRTGRPKSENPRNKRLEIKLTEEELNKINETSKAYSQSRTNTILHGIDLAIQELKKNNP